MWNFKDAFSILKKVLIRDNSIKIALVYCFAGFIIIHENGWIGIENALFASFEPFVLVISVIPAVLYIDQVILQSLQSSGMLVRVGRKMYFAGIKRLLGIVSIAVALYYEAVIYIVSKFFLTEGIWENSTHNLKVWVMEVLFFVLFFVLIAWLNIWSMIKALHPMMTSVLILAATYFWWMKIGRYGLWIVDIVCLITMILVFSIIMELRMQKCDFIKWR